MSTTFLLAYAGALVSSLLEKGLLEIPDGSQAAVVQFLADFLHLKARGGSLVTSTGRALMSCPDVLEFYADDDELKDVIDALRTGA